MKLQKLCSFKVKEELTEYNRNYMNITFEKNKNLVFDRTWIYSLIINVPCIDKINQVYYSNKIYGINFFQLVYKINKYENRENTFKIF